MHLSDHTSLVPLPGGGTPASTPFSSQPGITPTAAPYDSQQSQDESTAPPPLLTKGFVASASALFIAKDPTRLMPLGSDGSPFNRTVAINNNTFRMSLRPPHYAVHDTHPEYFKRLHKMRSSGGPNWKVWGGLFPLPGLSLVKPSRDKAPNSHKARARYGKQFFVNAATNATLSALNLLAGCPMNDVEQVVLESMGRTHARVVEHVGVKVASLIKELGKFANKPVDSDRWTFDYITDLHELLDDGIEPDPEIQKGAFCNIDPERLALPGPGMGGRVQMSLWLPPEDLDPAVVIKAVPPTPEELFKIPVVMGYAAKQYPSIVARLLEAAVIELSEEEPLCVNGLSAVRKDELWDRLIIDGRRGNMFLNTPPKVRLPNLADLARIVLLSDSQLYTAKADMSNQFYMLALPAAFRTYYGLPHIIIDEDLHRVTGIPVGTTVWPRMCVVPMGASWAVNWAQRTQSAVVSKAFRGTNVTCPGQLVIGRGLEPLWLSYIDDFHVFAADALIANKALIAGLEALTAAGFVENSKKRLNAQHDRHWTPVLGTQLSLSGMLCPDPTKMAEAIAVTLNIAYDGIATIRQMTQLLGVWVWFLLLNRPFLAILDQVYSFVDPLATPEEIWEKRKLTDSIVLELSLLVNIAPLLWVDLRRPALDLVFASDASQSGLGAACRIRPAEFDIFIPSERSGWYSKHASDVPVAIRTHNSVVDLCSNAEWQVVFAVCHSDGTSIVLREALAALAVIARVAISGSPPSRFLLLLDSSSLLGAFAKGRSASSLLNSMCRSLSALETIAQTRVLFSWVRTNLNPADEPSRLVPEQ